MTSKKIILGVTGSIAAYKSLLLVRLLVKAGNEVRVVMTPSATAFVSALSFSTLAKHKVHVDLIDGDSWSDHVTLGLWGDALVIAPATATTISKMANGLSDNMLVATYLSAKCPVFVAPAMDLDMWKHPATLANLSKLASYGHHMIPVGNGELASGLVGEGRMAEPEDIISFLGTILDKPRDLAGKNVLITAGPTRESIDPIRFISNKSTGTMGVALAEAAASRGANVNLILGPSNKSTNHAQVTTTNVVSAADMYGACEIHHKASDIVIFAAAVADYTPITSADKKIKKADDDLSIALKRTVDIAKTLGESKKEGQVHVGFALETHDGIAHAQGKLAKKNFDLIALNSLQDSGAGFGSTTNKITLLSHDVEPRSYELKSKTVVAHDILDAVVDLLA